VTATKNLHQKLTEKQPPSKLLQDVTSDNQPIYNKKSPPVCGLLKSQI